MIPMILTLEQIELAIRRRGAYQRPERVRLLEVCKRQLDILSAADKITREDYFRVNGRLMPLLSEEKWRLNRSQQHTQTTQPSTPSG